MDVNFSQLPPGFSGAALDAVAERSNVSVVSEKEAPRSELAGKLPEEVKVEETAADKESIETAVQDVRDFVQAQNRNLNFAFDEGSNRSVIKVTDAQSGDVIRQIPSEEVLKLAERIKELQSEVGAAVGVLFNKSV
ncbi:flagellar protein FlaG [Bowmanella denitrificans]|uniref:flagellar protein FlaG n=1 Tax=Bowmanella denitrificans TaxID=366582 RepID=UPI000C9A1BCB|nr:flagellar protein FlaG [Bowmanella denitrificans]